MSCAVNGVRSIRLLNYVPKTIGYMSRHKTLNRNIISFSRNLSCLGKINFSIVPVKSADTKFSSATSQTLRSFRFVSNMLKVNLKAVRAGLFFPNLGSSPLQYSYHSIFIFKILQNVDSTS